MIALKSLLFWIVFPLLIPQALYVRRTAPRFEPARGAAAGSVGDGEQVRLLAIGDSIIAGVGASDFSKALVGQTAMALATSRRCCVSWQALGVSGYDSGEVLEQLVPTLPGMHFDFIIVSVGVNDITGLTPIRKWYRNLSVLLDKLEAHSPDAMIAVTGIPPLHGFPLLPQPLRATLGLRARSFDEVAREVTGRRKNSRHIPVDFEPDTHRFALDGYHPSEDSYCEFGRHIADELLAMETINQTV